MTLSKNIIVHGGIPLVGEVRLSGSKHAALHILGAVLIAGDSVVIENFPNISDTRNLIRIYDSFGIRIRLCEQTLTISELTGPISLNTSQLDRVSLLRSSILLLGSALLRLNYVIFPFPGGDDIGQRDFAMFFRALTAFGIRHGISSNKIWARIESKLQGDRQIDIRVDPSSEVSGNNSTALAMILAAANQGSTRIIGALNVQETRVLSEFLRALGVSIEDLGTRTTTITSPGLSQLSEKHIRICLPPDKTEFAFWVAAASVTSGRIEIIVERSEPESITDLAWYKALVASAFEPLGLHVKIVDSNRFVVDAAQATPRPADIRARYTGIEAEIVDAMPLFVPILAKTKGTSTWEDTHVGRTRLGFVAGFRKMGAKFRLHGDRIIIKGVPTLTGGRVAGNDSRSAAALLLAALGTGGSSVVQDFDKVERVFDSIPRKLCSLGACVEYKSSSDL